MTQWSEHYETQLRNYVGESTDYYIRVWKKNHGKGAFASWNWAALFVPTFWLFYRKMYLWCVIMIVALWVAAQIPLGMILLHILFGLMANRLYYNRAQRAIERAGGEIERQKYNMMPAAIVWIVLQVVPILALYFAVLLGGR